MEFECDTTDFKKLEETIIQNIDCEGVEYNGKRWIKEDYCILKSVIREKIEELGEKQKATKDMYKFLSFSTARATLATLIDLDIKELLD